MPEQPTPPVCSECGRPEDLKAFRRSLRKRRAILGWSIALLALLIGVSAVIARTKTTGVSSGGFFPSLAEPVFTLAQVRAIAEHGADGTHEPGDLVRALQDLPDYAHPMHPGSRSLDLKFTTAEGARWSGTSWGWPATIVSRSELRDYDDAANRRGFKPARTDPVAAAMGKYERPNDLQRIPVRPLWEWQGNSLLYQPPPERTAGVYTTYSINPGGLAAATAVLLLLHAGLALLAMIVHRRRWRDVLTSRRRWALLGIVAAALLVAGVLPRTEAGRMQSLTGQSVQIGPPGPIYHADPELGRLPLKRTEVAQLPRTAESDALLAREILAAAKASESNDAQLLFVGSAFETQLDASTMTMGTYTFPLFNLIRAHYIRRPDFGTPEYVLPGRRFWLGLRRQHLGLWIVPGDAQRPVIQISVNPEIAGIFIVGAWVLGLAAALPIWIIEQRRLRRLRRHGACLFCGYHAFAPRP